MWFTDYLLSRSDRGHPRGERIKRAMWAVLVSGSVLHLAVRVAYGRDADFLDLPGLVRWAYLGLSAVLAVLSTWLVGHRVWGKGRKP